MFRGLIFYIVDYVEVGLRRGKVVLSEVTTSAIDRDGVAAHGPARRWGVCGADAISRGRGVLLRDGDMGY